LEQIRVTQYEKIKNIVHYVTIASNYDYEKFEDYLKYQDTKREKTEKQYNIYIENIIKIKPHKYRRTFAEIEQALIKEEYNNYLGFKDLKPNVFSFANYMKSFCKQILPYKNLKSLKIFEEKNKGLFNINYEIFLKFKVLTSNPSSYASFLKDYYEAQIEFGTKRCRDP